MGKKSKIIYLLSRNWSFKICSLWIENVNKRKQADQKLAVMHLKLRYLLSIRIVYWTTLGCYNTYSKGLVKQNIILQWHQWAEAVNFSSNYNSISQSNGYLLSYTYCIQWMLFFADVECHARSRGCSLSQRHTWFSQTTASAVPVFLPEGHPTLLYKMQWWVP